jgi:serine/threonine-protein kinase
VVALVVSSGTATSPEPPAAVETPAVVGRTASAASEALREAGLEVRIALVESSERRGTVVGQAPSAGTEVADGSTVQLEVAKARAAPPRIEVPDVLGVPAAEARSRLRAAGLRVRSVGVVSEEPAGTVLEQSPRAGAEVEKGASVRLTVSTGPAEVDVPDVTGLDESTARTELERAGFRVQVTDEPTADPAEDGVVLRQTPASGSAARDGAIVTLIVGRLG